MTDVYVPDVVDAVDVTHLTEDFDEIVALLLRTGEYHARPFRHREDHTEEVDIDIREYPDVVEYAHEHIEVGGELKVEYEEAVTLYC